VNSAFFRLARRITNIEQAVSYLGFAAIRNLVISAEIFSRWPSHDTRSVLNLDKLQSHVHQVAAVARSLAAGTLRADDALLAGLLHDIGYWVLANECPDSLVEAVATAVANKIPLYEAETRVIGASHAQIGAYLLGIWGLPYPVIEAVAHHHTPESIPQSELDALGAVTLAHALVPGDDTEAFNAPLVPDPKVDATFLSSLNAPFDWTEAEHRVEEINFQARDQL